MHPTLHGAPGPRSSGSTIPPRRPAGPPLAGEARGRPRRRRRRLHRAVDRAARRGARPGSRRRPARGGAVRLGGVRPQRRLLRGQPDARLRQRPRAVARRDRRARPARRRRTSTRSARRSPGSASTATSQRTGELARRRPRPHQVDELREEADATRGAATTVSAWTADAVAGAGRTRRPSWAALHATERRAGRAGPARLGAAAACLDAGVRIYEHDRGHRAARRRRARCVHRAGRRGHARAGWRWRRTRSRRCCAGSGARSCRSTTTC